MSPLTVAVGSAALMLMAAVSVLPAEVASAQGPSTAVLIPANNATVSGTSQVLDASASSGATQVTYEITGGTLSGSLIATGTPTYYGWLAQWNTTGVANGAYALQSVASYANGVSTSSSPVTINVNNPPPSTTVLIPSSGAALDSANETVFDAVASPGVTQVSFDIACSVSRVVLTATSTIYGWVDVTFPSFGGTPIHESCSVQSVASYSSGVSGTSLPVSFTLIVYFNEP